MNTVEKKTLGRLIAATLAHAGLVAAAGALGRELGPGPAAWALACLPVLPAAYALLVLARHVAAMDELQRLKHLQAAAFAIGATVLAGLVAGSLNAFAALPSPGLVWAVPCIAVGWMVGLALAHRRYA